MKLKYRIQGCQKLGDYKSPMTGNIVKQSNVKICGKCKKFQRCEASALYGALIDLGKILGV